MNKIWDLHYFKGITVSYELHKNQTSKQLNMMAA